MRERKFLGAPWRLRREHGMCVAAARHGVGARSARGHRAGSKRRRGHKGDVQLGVLRMNVNRMHKVQGASALARHPGSTSAGRAGAVQCEVILQAAATLTLLAAYCSRTADLHLTCERPHVVGS